MKRRAVKARNKITKFKISKLKIKIMKIKGEMIPGKLYRGWGYINDYKEFSFKPEQTGTRVGQIKMIKQEEGVTIKESKNLILINFNIDKTGKKEEYFGVLQQVYNTLFRFFKDYEI